MKIEFDIPTLTVSDDRMAMFGSVALQVRATVTHPGQLPQRFGYDEVVRTEYAKQAVRNACIEIVDKALRQTETVVVLK